MWYVRYLIIFTLPFASLFNQIRQQWMKEEWSMQDASTFFLDCWALRHEQIGKRIDFLFQNPSNHLFAVIAMFSFFSIIGIFIKFLISNQLWAKAMAVYKSYSLNDFIRYSVFALFKNQANINKNNLQKYY